MDSSLISQYFGPPSGSDSGIIKHTEACVVIRWWGEPETADRRLLYPKSLPGHSTASTNQPIIQRPFIARFPVVCTKSQISRYFADMRTAAFDVLLLLASGEEKLVGRLNLSDFGTLFQEPSRPINGFFPIYSIVDSKSPSKLQRQHLQQRKIAEAHVLVVLEDLLQARPPQRLANQTEMFPVDSGQKKAETAHGDELVADQSQMVERLLDRARLLQANLDDAIEHSCAVDNFRPMAATSDSQLSVDDVEIMTEDPNIDVQPGEESLVEDLLIQALNSNSSRAAEFLRSTRLTKSPEIQAEELLDGEIDDIMAGIQSDSGEPAVDPLSQSSALLLKLGRVNSLSLHLTSLHLETNSSFNLISFEVIVPGLQAGRQLQSAVYELHSGLQQQHDINSIMNMEIEFSDRMLRLWRKQHILIKACLVDKNSNTVVGISGVSCLDLLSAQRFQLSSLDLTIWECDDRELSNEAVVDRFDVDNWVPPLEGRRIGTLKQVSLRLDDISPAMRFAESAASKKTADQTAVYLPPTYLMLACRALNGLEIPSNVQDKMGSVFLSAKLPLDSQPVESRHVQVPAARRSDSLPFNFHFSTPLAMNEKQQSSDRPLVIEVWFAEREGKRMELIGLVKLPLHRLVDLAVQQHKRSSSSLADQSPLLLPLSEYCVIDPITGMARGWAECMLAMGTLSQIQAARQDWLNVVVVGDSSRRRDIDTNTSLTWLADPPQQPGQLSEGKYEFEQENTAKFCVAQMQSKQSLAAGSNSSLAAKASASQLPGKESTMASSTSVLMADSNQPADAVPVIIAIEQAIHLPLQLHASSSDSPINSIAPNAFSTINWPSFISDESITTTIIPNSTSPRWDYRSTISIDRAAESLARFRSDKLEINVHHSHQEGGTSRLIGQAKVDLSPLLFGMPFINGWYRLIDPRSGNQAGQIKIGVQPLEPLHRVNDRSRPQEIRAVDEDVTEMNDLQQELRQSIAVLESINDRLQGKLRQSLFERKQFHPSISQASRLVHAPMQINQQNSDNDGALQLADLMDDEVAVRHPISAKPLFSGGIDNNGADSQRDIDTLVQNSEAGDSNDGEHSEMGGESSDLRLPRRPLKSLLSPIRDQRSMGTEESKRIGRIFSANFESVVIPPIPSRRPASGILQSQSDDSLERLRNDLDK